MSLKNTSICILRWDLKDEIKMRKIEREIWNTPGTGETPFLLSATHLGKKGLVQL